MNQRSSDAVIEHPPQPLSDLVPKPGDLHDSGASSQDAPDRQSVRPIVNDETPAPARQEPAASQAENDDLKRRLARLERQSRWLKLTIAVALIVAGFTASRALLPPGTIVKQTLMESKELKLLDNDGQPRLFLRMYSRVPVLQLLDANGKPRMSLGLRFDDTPFFDLSDKTGRTRASIELSASGEPLIELFDENGDSSTRIR